MPKIVSSVARKDYPAEGIRKGQTYYSWKPYRGATQRSATYPRPSQLTNSKMKGVYEAMESMTDAVSQATSPEDIASLAGECATACRAIADEYRDSASNFGVAGTNAEWEAKADSIDSYCDDLEAAAAEVEALSIDDYIDEDEAGEREVKKPTKFDELSESEKDAMLQACVTLVEEPQCDA